MHLRELANVYILTNDDYVITLEKKVSTPTVHTFKDFKRLAGSADVRNVSRKMDEGGSVFKMIKAVIPTVKNVYVIPTW